MSQPAFRTGLATLIASGSAPLIVLHGVTMKRRAPFRQFHRYPPVYSLRVHWVPLFPSSHRLGAFAFRPPPGVHGFPVRRLLRPIRHFLRHWGFVGVSLTYSPLPFASGQEASRVHNEGLKRNAGGGVLLNAPSPLWGSPIFLQGRVRLTWSPITDHPMQSSLVLTLHKKAFQARRADIISKVCQGPRFP